MFLNTLLAAVPVRGEADRAVLCVHSTMLEHGFQCIASAGETNQNAVPCVTAGAEGSASVEILPRGWNSSADNFSLNYVHPLRGTEETFTIKALSMGQNFVVHAASSLSTAELLTVTLTQPTGTTVDPATLKTWQEKIAATICMRLLSRHNSTARLEKALAGGEATTEASGGTKRPAPEEERPGPGGGERAPERSPHRDPFTPGFLDPRGRPPLLWTPDGGLLGPRHPAWGQVMPGRGGSGMMPRFDPIGPGGGEPDPDHMHVPGMFPDGDAPFFPPGPGQGFFPDRGRGGRFDPDGMFFS